MRSQWKLEIKLFLKTVHMQAKLDDLKLALLELDEQLNEQSFEDLAEKLNAIQLSFEQIFTHPELLSPEQFPALRDIETRYSQLYSHLVSLQLETKKELVGLVKNKKKIGFYSQSK